MSQEHYARLLAMIADLAGRQRDEYGDQIRCQRGCFTCCRPPDSLFLIEVEPLIKVIRTLDASQKQLVSTQLSAYTKKNRELCPLLEENEGSCMVYDARPSICRSHGYAVWIKTSKQSELSWCPLNFTKRAPTREFAFDVERLNQMLALMTKLTWPHADGRRDLCDLIAAALFE